MVVEVEDLFEGIIKSEGEEEGQEALTKFLCRLFE